MTTHILHTKKLLNKMDLFTILKTAGISILAFIAPIQGLMLLVGATIILDTIVGIYTAHKMGDEITSSKFFNLSVKIFFYLSTIVLGYLVDIFIFGGTLPVINITNGIAKIMAIFWIYNECKSLDEHNIRLGGKPVADRIKEILSNLKGLKKDLKDLTEDKDKE